jgi:plasmid stabilization system protein ParE
MTRELFFHPEVRQDMDEAWTWYEAREPGLGENFRMAVRTALDEIERCPAGFARVKGTIRSAPISRFPYRVYFRIRKDFIRVLAIVHNRRHPRIWQGR